MIRVKEAIVVEGKYDKIKLSSLVDGVIIETNGFGIFKDREGINALDARGTFLMDGLKSQFHPDRFSAV